ncbi:cellulase [Pedobacter yulinensis]|uniref:Cellulase n=1 Tax=Pedobacter yulinensis TaxID=2126353 RepID=A0A2T3HRV4_9SPHI|nr:glycoside hydrolase family 9 protein [Pedobacter yulinensis]PST85133.1 cellulase [Pedobacter yulinensis]
MKCLQILLTCISFFICLPGAEAARTDSSWVRINLLGYRPAGIKVAVWVGKGESFPRNFEVVEKGSGKVAYAATARPFGKYGPFSQTARLDFSGLKKPGRYLVRAGGATSPEVIIADDVYRGSADFCLRYMRQQRCGFNPFLKDSCHTRDGFALYARSAGLKDSAHVDATGGWHDASDYLQYSTTSANAAAHLLLAYRDFPQAFGDTKQANGLEGANGRPDVLDEAKWGLDWLLKMHPSRKLMFNQVADDRDHLSMRIPKMDSQYGKGFERPVYFIDGEVQQRGKLLNATTGTSSTAAKLSSAFFLGAGIFKAIDRAYAALLSKRSASAYAFAERKPGVTQTVSVKSPYIYAEENWTDDMELASALRARGRRDLDVSRGYAGNEPVTPWLLRDTAAHYQYYPFLNLGHRELAKRLDSTGRREPLGYYRSGIDAVWSRAKGNAFFRGVPFIWCSNNLTVAFAMQCMWYRQLSADHQFAELEQANIDWLLGCNPWGTSMVFGLPQWGDTPVDPHSAFTHLKNYPVDGGLVDGPVYTSIYKNLIGIALTHEDSYAAFQSDMAVYHDDYGDYSTNEPTMDGTASLIYLLASQETGSPAKPAAATRHAGAIIRGDRSQKKIALVFTADQYADGAPVILPALRSSRVQASFFLTGNFYRNPEFRGLIRQMKQDGHYLGAHSDQHLLYCDWNKRDSTLLTRQTFLDDLDANYAAMRTFGIDRKHAPYFLPPYEWYNEEISRWTSQAGLQLVNFSPGTRSNADYTWPAPGTTYLANDEIEASIKAVAQRAPDGLNGFMLLLHLGTDARRTEKFYGRVAPLLQYLQEAGYEFVRIDELPGLKNEASVSDK